MRSFIRTGYAPYCLIRYEDKAIDCSYATMHDCREQLGRAKASVCVAGKDVKYKGGKKQ